MNGNSSSWIGERSPKSKSLPCNAQVDRTYKKIKLDFIVQMTGQLRTMALDADEPMLIYMLEMAYAEAYDRLYKLAENDDGKSLVDDLKNEQRALRPQKRDMS